MPTNTAEYAACALLMLLAGIAWAYIIGQICGIAANGNPVTAAFNKSNDSMNKFMASQKLPPEFRCRVRTYLLHSKDTMQEISNQDIICKLSPSLAGEMVSMGHRWVREGMVKWATPGVASYFFMARLIKGLGCSTHPPREVIPGKNRMLILRKGTCFTETLVMVSSKCTVWNSDFFLSNKLLRKNTPGRTITYVQVDFLERSFFMEVLGEGWEEMPKLKSAFRKIALFRGLQFMQSHEGMLPVEWVKYKGMENKKSSAAMLKRTRSLSIKEHDRETGAAGSLAAEHTAMLRRIESRLDNIEGNIRLGGNALDVLN